MPRANGCRKRSERGFGQRVASSGTLGGVPPIDPLRNSQRRLQQEGQKPRQDALGNKLPDPNEELTIIEKELTELKIQFEQYFLGIERKSPGRRRDLLGERIRKLKTSGTIRNTALKFRLEQLSTKFGSYDRMWQRTLTEIENGTYRRDLFKMKMKQERATEKPLAAPPSERKPARAAEGPALSDGQLRALYDTYMVARQRTNESTSGITYDALANTLRKQVPELMRKHEAKAIDFKVVIKNGKAMLKAVPRK